MSSDGRIRVGVIGCGSIAQIMHLPYLRELDDRFVITCPLRRVAGHAGGGSGKVWRTRCVLLRGLSRPLRQSGDRCRPDLLQRLARTTGACRTDR